MNENNFKANRAAAFESLRAVRQATAQSTSALSSEATSAVVGPTAYPQVPANSRDATLSSRYFSNPTGRILVANSSPIQAHPVAQAQRTTVKPSDRDVASTQHQHLVSHAKPDVATLSTGFVNGTINPHSFINQANLTHRGLFQTMNMKAGSDSRSKSDPVMMHNLHNSPRSSPDVGPRVGHRRISSNISDDSDLQASPVAPARLIRNPTGRDAQSTSSGTTSISEDKDFNRFRILAPTEPLNIVKAAWEDANRDSQEAFRLIKDYAWRSQTTAKHNAQATTGKFVDRNKAKEQEQERAAIRQKKQESAIYAKRSALPTAPNVATATIIDLTDASTPSRPKRYLRASSPATPLNLIPPKKKARKVIESESESDVGSEADSEAPSNTKSLMGVAPEERAFEYFNTSSAGALQELTGCNIPQAAHIISLRPFRNVDDLETRLNQGGRKAGYAGLSPRIFEDCVAIFEGYNAVDSILKDCEDVGEELRKEIMSWTSSGKGKGKDVDSIIDQSNNLNDGALDLKTMDLLSAPCSLQKSQYLTEQPAILSKDVQLKDYQLLGVNWLNLLYNRSTSCILADEMGLGKTIQVISFFAHLKSQGRMGPHLVVVPASTLENWCREFARFAPTINVQTYYANKAERPELRDMLLKSQRSTMHLPDGWEVLVTTYNLAAQGDEYDRKFFRRVQWDTCVFDEGHVLKNFQSQRYTSLIRFASNWRLLLTGTPLQNNLQELVSVMNFVHPNKFSGDKLDSLRAIFKVKGDTKISLLAQERVSRAKRMMTPYVLRRRKDQVLKDLPNKVERIEWCEMTELQSSIYTNTLQRSRKTVFELDTEGAPTSDVATKAKKAIKAKEKVYQENSSNVLMDLRKAASHPMLFRTRFTDKTLTAVTKVLLKEDDFARRNASFQYVKEDMEVMTDAELQVFMGTYKATKKYELNSSCYVDAGKVQKLLQLLVDFIDAGRKILIFSQFTQILDILKVVLQQRKMKYLMLTGMTPVDIRQSLVDEFTEDDSIPVFLLSTKAGGMGINLTAASVVILFDQDFNPHNDRQAQDRAYRIGQKREVDIIRLITRGTIEEDMLLLGQTKLALDSAVAGDGSDNDTNEESLIEKNVKKSLMHSLRSKFEQSQIATEQVDIKLNAPCKAENEDIKPSLDTIMADP